MRVDVASTGPARSGLKRYCSGAAKPGVYIGFSFDRLLGERMRAAPKSSSTGRPSIADEDVGRLDVEVQQLVRVHFAQAVQQVDEELADEAPR